MPRCINIYSFEGVRETTNLGILQFLIVCKNTLYRHNLENLALSFKKTFVKTNE